MKIDAYKTKFGLFSVIDDTELYQAVTNETTAYENLYGLYYPAIVATYEGQIVRNQMVSLLGAAVPGYVPVVVEEDLWADYPEPFVYNDETLEDNRILHYAFRRSNAYITSYGYLQFITPPVPDTPAKISIIGRYYATVNGAAESNLAQTFVFLTNGYTQFKLISINASESQVSYSVGGLNSTQQNYYSAFFQGLDPYEVPVSDDPYSDGEDSYPGGGGGTFDYDSIITGGFDDFQLPQNSAIDTGFLTLYNPSASELKALSDYLWSSSFDLNTFKKLVNDPMDLILGLSILPISIPQGGREEIGIGMIGTGITMATVSTQWVKVDCGSVTIPNYTGSYLDYDPYTSVEIYLPFIGTRTLKADEVMGRTISVGYAIDILSGACVAWVDVDGSLMYTYMGQCATSIPVVSGDWTNVINGILSVVGSAAGGAIKGGVGGAIAGGVAAASSVAVNDSKISVERSGNISGAAGLLAYKRPFIIINAPRICKPLNQHLYTGYPSYITQELVSISGYTEVDTFRLYDIPATESEIDEIKALLHQGVIL